MSAGFRFVGGPMDGQQLWLPSDPPEPFHFVAERKALGLPFGPNNPIDRNACTKILRYAYNPETNCYHHTP